MKKTLILLLKLAAMAVIIGFVGREVYRSLHDPRLEGTEWARLDIHWGYAPLAVLAFCGVMLTSGLVWRFLARRMGDRGPLPGLLGAYTFSQMGKYIPGKVALLLMRIERVGRFGMSARVCTLSTLLENALYMISGGLAGMLALLAHARDLAAEGRTWALPAAGLVVAGLLGVCHPAVFYGLVNTMLRKMKKEPVPPAAQLRMPTLVLSVLLFLPCWMFGGLSLWASTAMVEPAFPLARLPGLMGAFALSVIVGMISFLPGGLGTRDAMLVLFLRWELQPLVGPGKADLLAVAAVVAQRLAQIAAEVILGVAGMALTAFPPPGRHTSAPSEGSDRPARIHS